MRGVIPQWTKLVKLKVTDQCEDIKDSEINKVIKIIQQNLTTTFMNLTHLTLIQVIPEILQDQHPCLKKLHLLQIQWLSINSQLLISIAQSKVSKFKLHITYQPHDSIDARRVKLEKEEMLQKFKAMYKTQKLIIDIIE
ncbi:hypothetical protein FGO68_gene8519 [Halteria grandinella]|uniref:Uncharacterized protein n=1 Tax=Halteria grandinella TaxID=5974 RepID=A0A8J8NXR3_HALGN|nr:hypothetical protein FGO68_gene8519 [Halteria grandinella]